MEKRSKHIRVFCDTNGVHYQGRSKRMSKSFILLGLSSLVLVYPLVSWHEIVKALPLLSFSWVSGFIFIYVRALHTLGKFLTREKLTSQSTEIRIPCGWDGTSRFLQVFGIPIDDIGVTLGVLIGLYSVRLFSLSIMISVILLFGSGVLFAIGSYYLVLESRYNIKIFVYEYGMNPSSE
jgi:hypothetical protein